MRIPRKTKSAQTNWKKPDGRLRPERSGRGWSSILTVIITLAMLVASALVFYLSSKDTDETRFYNEAERHSRKEAAEVRTQAL